MTVREAIEAFASGILRYEGLYQPIVAPGMWILPDPGPRNISSVEATMENAKPAALIPEEWEIDPNQPNLDLPPGDHVVFVGRKDFPTEGHAGGLMMVSVDTGGLARCSADPSHRHGRSWLAAGNKLMRRKSGCPKCGTPIQKFPTLEAELPCVNCTPGAMVKLPLRYAGGYVALMFEHVFTVVGPGKVKHEWAPQPCIDRSVDADLTRRLTEAGLTVCLVDSARPAQKEPQQSPIAPNTVSDNKGRYARDHVPDAVAGCRLGCACKEHRPPREPYVPSVTDWDLLADA